MDVLPNELARQLSKYVIPRLEFCVYSLEGTNTVADGVASHVNGMAIL